MTAGLLTAPTSTQPEAPAALENLAGLHGVSTVGPSRHASAQQGAVVVADLG